ncbi:MAG: phosphatase PAP2 family protein [Chloroflexi bacterium]|nr:phosphatase PAP2 family protein [Chloroflexota bacterium]
MTPGEEELEVFQAINGMAGGHPLLDAIASVFVGDYFVPVVLALALLGLWFGAKDATTRERQQRAIMVATLAVIIANITVLVINGSDWGLARPRPFEVDPHAAIAASSLFYPPPDPAFPSNSMAVAFALVASIAWANRGVALFMALFAVLMGISRVYAGVHFPGDILAGGSVGITASFVALAVLRLAEPLPSGLLKVARRLYLA